MRPRVRGFIHTGRCRAKPGRIDGTRDRAMNIGSRQRGGVHAFNEGRGSAHVSTAGASLARSFPRLADLCYLLAATGCRISEALAARWSDIGPDPDGRPCLTIPKSKTPSGERVLPLSPQTVRRLTKRRAEARFADADDPIFPSEDGTQLDAHNYRSRVFRPAAKRAGVGWATPHALRHGLASLMAQEGYSAARIAAQLGHADGGVLALRTYIHADPLEAADFVDEALRASSKPG